MTKAHLSILIFLSLYTFSFGQKFPEPEALKAEIWGEESPEVQLTEVPAKWSNESAVVLYQESFHEYRNSASSIYAKEYQRKRIKLLDKSAIEKFSEFSFTEATRKRSRYVWSTNKQEIYSGIKVIKSDGSEREIDTGDAVDTSNPEKQDFFQVIAQDKKIAIPNLETGDIIDFYRCTISNTNQTFFIKFPYTSTLSEEYPVIEQKIILEFDERFNVSFNNLNGAPSFEKVATPKRKANENLLSKSESFNRYELIDKNRDKLQNIPWLYKEQALPIVEIQVAYGRNKQELDRSGLFIGERGEIKSSVSEDDILNVFARNFNSMITPYPSIKDLTNHLKEKGLYRKKGKEREMLQEAFLYDRFNSISNKEEKLILKGGDPRAMYRIKSIDHTRRFIKLFKDQDIDFEMLTVVPRNLGRLDDLLISISLRTFLKVNLEEPLYLNFSSNHRLPGSFSHFYEGVDAYSIKFDGLIVKSVKRVSNPTTDFKENRALKSVSLSINPDFETINAKRISTFTGQHKHEMQDTLIAVDDYVDAEYKSYNGTPLDERKSFKWEIENGETIKQGIERLQSLKDKEVEGKRKVAQNLLKNDYDFSVSNFKNFRFLSLGRTLENPNLSYEEEFQIDDIIKKAGPHYLLEIPKLIENQVGLSEKEMDREYGAYFDYARSYETEIELKIPVGYTVEGLESLNVSIDNEYGSFISTVKQEGNTLKITAQKNYKTLFVEADEWPKVVVFLEAAFQFSQERLLLKKI